VFDIGLGELLVLVVAALFVFGPDRLPGVAAQAVKTLRALREMASSAGRDINDAIGPELRELDVRQDLQGLRDLDPRRALGRLGLDDDAPRPANPGSPASPVNGGGAAANGVNGAAGATERPTSYDPDAT
jgi:sec-independent protein translocase protein TatB